MIDGNAETVLKYKSQYPNYRHGQLPNLPYQDNFFNVIHCSHVIEHLSSNDFFILLKECDRCLKYGGHLIFSTPLLWDQFWDDLSHVRPYYPKIFKKYLCKEINNNPTRGKISEDYTIVDLQYRYNLKPIVTNVIITRSEIINYIYQLIIKLLNRFGFRFIEKTGYTIILQKVQK